LIYAAINKEKLFAILENLMKEGSKSRELYEEWQSSVGLDMFKFLTKVLTKIGRQKVQRIEEKTRKQNAL